VTKYFKTISIFFIWIACLILFAHQLIPHDHHSDISFSDDKIACTSHQSNQGSHNHTGFPMHCHSLNDLTFEKRLIVMPSCNELQIFCFLSLRNNDLKSIEEAIIQTFFIVQKEPLFSCRFFTSSSLRAPPTLA
jgi:hypothetical protein